MEQQQSMFKKKELVVAVGVALLSGVMSGCGSSGSSTPVAAAGIYTVDVSGGNGGDFGGDGGEAGYLHVENNGGTGGVLVSASGMADASFTSPVPAVTADTGANPLAVTADTTILTPMYTYDTPVADAAAVTPSSIYIGTDGILYTDDGDGYAQYATDAVVGDERYYTDGSELYQAIDDTGTEIANLVAAGTPYRLNGDEIYLADGTAATADVRATGISVASGATLTVENYGGYGGSITVAADIANEGTITLAERGNSHSLYLNSDRYIGSGTIDNRGVLEGESAGGVYLYAGNGIHNSGSILASGADSTTGTGGDGAEISLYAPSYIQNSGMLDAHGADGADGSEGGYGGHLMVRGAYVENSGDIDVSGGDDGVNGFGGGFGGSAYIYSFFDLNNSGDINTSMGDGGYGGDCCRTGGYVKLTAGSDGGEGNGIGTLRNSGNIDATGGDKQYGGDTSYGGNIYLYGYGGGVVNNGNLDVSGGNVQTDLADTYGYSGYGGQIRIASASGYGNTPAGDVMISGNLSSHGGDAPVSDTVDSYTKGGEGGRIRIGNSLNDSVSDQIVALYGYTSINADGGDGASANYGGDVKFTTGNQWNAQSGTYLSGSIVNEVDISARGGNPSTSIDRATGSSSSYGYGGYVNMSTSDYEGMASSVTVTNSGDIDVSGGNVINATRQWVAAGGGVYLYGYNGAQNSGAIDASGGTDEGTMGAGNGTGGYGGNVEIFSNTGAVANSGVLTVNGGDGAYEGGDAGYGGLAGFTVNNSGNLTANGGNASTAEGVTESYGGNGGYFNMFGVSALNAAINTATLSYSAGTGVTPGSEGSAQIGIVCEGNCSGM